MEILEKKDLLSAFTFNGEWCDAEKFRDNTDDDALCWAASAANMLSWSGWSDLSAQETFEHLQEHSDDSSGLPAFAIQWWFDGSGIGPMYDSDGYYQELDYHDYYTNLTYGDEILNDAEVLLKQGYVVSLQVRRPFVSSSHIITMWGIDTDDSGNPLGIYVTDSDDNQIKGIPLNTLQYYDVEFNGEKWCLQNYYSDSIHYIQIGYALKAKTEKLDVQPQGGIIVNNYEGKFWVDQNKDGVQNTDIVTLDLYNNNVAENFSVVDVLLEAPKEIGVTYNITSPNGTTVILDNTTTTRAFHGEDSIGEWTVEVISRYNSNPQWKLIVSGSETTHSIVNPQGEGNNLCLSVFISLPSGTYTIHNESKQTVDCNVLTDAVFANLNFNFSDTRFSNLDWINLVRSHWGTPLGDLNGDGKTDSCDLDLLRHHNIN